MGNAPARSGHLNLGAGSVVRQDLTRIDDAVLDGGPSPRTPRSTTRSPAPERVHLIGLVSDGGVHSSLGHLQALIELAGRLSVRDLVVHCFTDGRDTLPESGRRARPVWWSAGVASSGPSGRSREHSPPASIPRSASIPVSARAAGHARRPSSAAGTRWTATAVGSASRPPTTCSSTAAPPTMRTPGLRLCARRTHAGRPTSSSPPPPSAPRA